MVVPGCPGSGASVRSQAPAVQAVGDLAGDRGLRRVGLERAAALGAPHVGVEGDRRGSGRRRLLDQGALAQLSSEALLQHPSLLDGEVAIADPRLALDRDDEQRRPAASTKMSIIVKTRSSTIVTPRSHFSARTLLLTLASSMASRPTLCAVTSLIGRGRLRLNPSPATLDEPARRKSKGRARRPALPAG